MRAIPSLMCEYIFLRRILLGKAKKFELQSALNVPGEQKASFLPFLPLLNAKLTAFLRLQPYKKFRDRQTCTTSHCVLMCLLAAEVLVGCTVERLNLMKGWITNTVTFCGVTE